VILPQVQARCVGVLSRFFVLPLSLSILFSFVQIINALIYVGAWLKTHCSIWELFCPRDFLILFPPDNWTCSIIFPYLSRVAKICYSAHKHIILAYFLYCTDSQVAQLPYLSSWLSKTLLSIF